MFSTSTALVALFALGGFVLASLPFFTLRFFGFKKLSYKPLGYALLESLVLFALWFGAFMLYESALGKTQNQGWQFYVIALCLWGVLAFPAFAWTRLRKA